MKTIQAILVTIWGAVVVIPSFAQEAHLRILAATGSVQEIHGSNHDAGVIAVLINAGADINARSRSGETALFYAAQSNPNPEMLSAPLTAGAALDDRDALGRTPLMAAAWGNSNPSVVTLLLKAGADARAKSRIGKTALDYARDNPSMSPPSGDVYQALQEAMK